MLQMTSVWLPKCKKVNMNLSAILIQVADITSHLTQHVLNHVKSVSRLNKKHMSIIVSSNCTKICTYTKDRSLDSNAANDKCTVSQM